MINHISLVISFRDFSDNFVLIDVPVHEFEIKICLSEANDEVLDLCDEISLFFRNIISSLTRTMLHVDSLRSQKTSHHLTFQSNRGTMNADSHRKQIEKKRIERLSSDSFPRRRILHSLSFLPHNIPVPEPVHRLSLPHAKLMSDSIEEEKIPKH
jgi:hypothetical protein